MYYERAKAVLGTEAPAARDLPLMRGHEVIRAPARKKAAAKKTPAAKTKAAPAKKAKKTAAKR
jgi:hypothetical protein